MPKPTSGFACMECGHKFKTVKAAEKASFGDKGCPKCGGADIDLVEPVKAGARVQLPFGGRLARIEVVS